MIGRQSIQIRVSFQLIITALLIGVALFASLKSVKLLVLRNEAIAVTHQILSFQSWVSLSGTVWVNKLADGFHDYLDKKPDASGGYYYSKIPALAIREYSKIANKISKRASFKVTSDKLRQKSNAPDAFEQSAIKKFKNDPSITFVDGFENDKYRYIKPLLIEKSCLKCHGDPKDAPKILIAKYGDQKAFGYKIGDVRGVISIKLPDIKLAEILPSLGNPITIALLILAFLMNFIFIEYNILRPIRNLTESAEDIARGDMDVELDFNDPDDSKYEIDHLYNAVDLLRNSLKVAMRRMGRRRRQNESATRSDQSNENSNTGVDSL